jgi:hypothetical protein
MASDVAPLPRADGTVDCETAADCRGFDLAYCGQVGPIGPLKCLSGCLTDADCGTGAVCLCSDRPSATGGTCLAKNDCVVDADCGPGSLCLQYYRACFGEGFACSSPDDECLSTDECAADQICLMADDPTGGHHRTCEDHVICNGRPFLVEEKARVAWVEPGRSWLGKSRRRPSTEHLTASERAELAAHWSRLGQMEHASIAAFARFQLQLLALGAPAELIEACTRALADETAHTRLCFELASAYAERDIGAGPLDVAHSLDAVSLLDVLDLVLLEGCFGETSAALEAIEAAERAVDPVIVAAYDQIAADEQRHAELAFKFVQWALARGGSAARQRVERMIEAPPRGTHAVHSISVPCLSTLLESFNDELAAG